MKAKMQERQRVIELRKKGETMIQRLLLSSAL